MWICLPASLHSSDLTLMTFRNKLKTYPFQTDISRSAVLDNATHGAVVAASAIAAPHKNIPSQVTFLKFHSDVSVLFISKCKNASDSPAMSGELTFSDTLIGFWQNHREREERILGVRKGGINANYSLRPKWLAVNYPEHIRILLCTVVCLTAAQCRRSKIVVVIVP